MPRDALGSLRALGELASLVTLATFIAYYIIRYSIVLQYVRLYLTKPQQGERGWCVGVRVEEEGRLTPWKLMRLHNIQGASCTWVRS